MPSSQMAPPIPSVERELETFLASFGNRDDGLKEQLDLDGAPPPETG